MIPAISIEQITKKFGQNVAVNNVTFNVEPGEIFGFLGPNGAGKSTMINMMLDVIRPTSGRVSFFGTENSGDTAALRRDIGYLFGDMELYGAMSGLRYLKFVSRVSGNLSWKRVDELASRLRIDLSLRIRTLSRGNKQKIGLIAALARDTKLLILDEPTTGLDPLIQQQFNEFVLAYQKDGGTVFVSSHILSEVQILCDRVAFIKAGEIIQLGTFADLLRDARKRVIIHASKSTLQQIEKLPNLHGFTMQDDTAQFDLSGNPAPILAQLPMDSIKDITITPLELEEVFRGYYEESKRENF
jgi:ABC-2 type transport system ATP-binding protein